MRATKRALAFTTAALGAIVFALGWFSLDGPVGLLCLGPNTRYSDGYSERAFRKVSVGLPDAQLVEVLGESLNEFVRDDGIRLLGYSWRTGDRGWYRLRTVVVEKGLVSAVYAECTDE
ncbi:MAG: hypothetical protein U0228_24570 [Myxococcaceae bacterium]